MRNMFDRLENGTPKKWANPGLDGLGPTQQDMQQAERRATLRLAKEGKLGEKKVRKSYYEKQLERFGFK